MKVKRFILMLLVTLGSVTAWAQNNVIRYIATSKLNVNWTDIGESQTRYKSHTYDPASNLGIVTYNDDITTITGNAFSGVEALISIDLPASVTSIRQYAFYRCNSLTSLDIPAGVTDFGNGIISDCTALKTIIINSQQTLDATGYYWLDNERRGYGNIPRTFKNNIAKYILKGNITGIPKAKFRDCSITSITLPEMLISIEDQAFMNCSLQSVTIPRTVTSIKSEAFYGCHVQSIIVLATTPPSLGIDCFANVDKSIPVYVPEGTAAAYTNASGWNEFTNIKEVTPHRLTLVSSNTSLGKVYGTGRYDYGTEVTIYAAPEAGNRFTRWSDGNTENPRQYVVTSDATLTATFEALNVFQDPTGAGMRLKITKKDNKVYEFKTQDVKSVDYYRVNE